MRYFSERTFFFLLLGLALLPVWSGRFFVTGDGPCHVYNARVLLDYMQGRNVDFYAPFYQLNTNFEPNWFGHLCLAAFQVFLAPELAEKVFLSGYVLLFGFGLRFLIRQINPESLFMSSVGLLFVWHHLLLSGFYNYAASIALFFWVCGWWMKCRHDWTPPRLLLLSLLWLVLYSAHPMGLVFSGAFIGSAMLWDAYGSGKAGGWKGAGASFFRQVKQTGLAALPMLVLLAEYLFRRPGHPDGNSETALTVAHDLAQLSALITLDSTERDIVKAVGILIGLLSVAAIGVRFQNRTGSSSDFILLFLGICMWQYFKQAGAQSIELLMPLRIQIFPWLALLLLIATATFPGWVRLTAPVLALGLMTALLYIRLPLHRRASAQVEDYLSCLPHIRDRSVIMVLNYEFGGSDAERRPVGNRTWLFNHAADYIGAYRTSIMSDNYEALRFYFPFSWNWQRDMFNQTAKDGINFDNRPPRADLTNFHWRSGGYDIDYVLRLNYDERHFNHPYANEIQDQLDKGYRFVFGSPGQRLEVWERKK